MEDVIFQRFISDCFYLTIPNEPEAEVHKMIRDSFLVEQAVKVMINGSISPEELLEMVEPVIPNMDHYIDEVEENLAEIYLV